MTFGNNFRTDKIPSLNTFEEAKRYYLSVAPTRGWVNTPGSPRFLAERTNKNKTIRMTQDRVICRLYRTDVVTYHSDNTVEIEPYASTVTNDFAAKLLARWANVRTQMVSPLGPILWLGQRGYKFPGASLRVTQNAEIAENSNTPDTFTKYGVNTAVMNTAYRETGYRDFQAWHQAAWKSGSLADLRQRESWLARTWMPNGGQRLYATCYNKRELNDQVLDLLRERRFRDLVSLIGAAPSNVDEVRSALMRVTPGSVVSAELPYITSYREIASLRSLQVRWGAIV